MQKVGKKSDRRQKARPCLPLAALICTALIWSVPWTLSWAASQNASPSSGGPFLQRGSPVHISSDRMDVDQAGRTILFQGHVVVQQDNLTITGRSLKVFAAPNATDHQQGDGGMMDRIDRLEMEGDVRISQEDRLAAAERAVYYHQEQKIVLMGNPRVSQGPDRIEGQLITLFLDEGRSVVEGGSESPVRAVLHPSRQE